MTTEHDSNGHSPEIPAEAPEQSAVKAYVALSKRRLSDGRGRAEQWFDGHRDRPVIDLGLRLYTRDVQAAGGVVGSAVAFRLFLFFVPTVLFVVGVVGFLSGYIANEELDDAGITGTLATQISTALNQSSSTRWIAVGVGLIGMATAGRTLSKALTQASCLAWQLPLRSKATVRVIGCVVGLLVSMALMSVFVGWLRHSRGLGVAGISFVAALGLYAVAWLVLMSLLPRRQPSDPGVLLPGAVLMAVTLAGLQAFSQLYLPSRFDRASQLYGSIGAMIVSLGWFFICGRVMVSSMVLNAVVFEKYGSITKLTFSLPVLRALPRKSAWLRHQLLLDEPDIDGEHEGGLA